MQSKCKLFAKVLIFSDIPNFFCKKTLYASIFCRILLTKQRNTLLINFAKLQLRHCAKAFFYITLPVMHPYLK